MMKYITSLFSVFFLSQIVFSTNNKYDAFGYIRQDNEGKYILTVKQGDKYGVVDIFDNEIIKREYSSLAYLKEGLFRVGKDSLYGYFDVEGKLVLPIEYTQSPALKYSQTKDYLKAEDFYLLYKNGKYGVFDRKRKKITLPVDYDYIIGKDFAEDIINTSKLKNQIATSSNISALVKKYNKQSLIDLKTGKTIINFDVYDSIEPSDKYGYIVVKKGEKNAIVDYNNAIIIPFQDDPLSIGKFGFLSYSQAGRSVQLISKSTLDRSKKYAAIDMYFNGLSQVKQNNKKGVINAHGKEIVPPNYDHIYITDNYIEAIEFGQSEDNPAKTSFFNLDGRALFKPLAYSGAAYDVKSGMVIINDFDNNTGLLDKSGKLIMPLKYRRIYIEENASVIRFEVNSGSGVNMGLADMKGKIVVKPKYDQIDEFIDGVAEIGVKTSKVYKHGLINLHGEEILKPQFSSIFFNLDSAKHYAQVYENNQVGIISRDGKIIIPPVYDEVIYQDRSTDDWGNLIIAKRNGLSGVVDMCTGKIIAEPQYNYIHTIGKGDSLLLGLRSDEGNCIINKEGQTLIPLTKDIIYPLSTQPLYLIRKISDGKIGILSISNEELIPAIYDKVALVNEELFIVEKDAKVGILNKHNEEIFPLEFDLIMPYSLSYYPNLLLAKRGNEWGFIFLDRRAFESSPLLENMYNVVIKKESK